MSELPTHPPPPYPPPPPDPPARPRRVLPVVLSVVAAVVLVSVTVTVPLVLREVREDRARAAPVNLDAVEGYDDLDRTHTDEDVDYPQGPPVGGPHAPVWLDCGVYDEPVREENLVHDLEHGTVFIAHDPGLDEDDIEELAELLPANGILAPYVDLAGPVVVTVWGRQLALDGADDPRLPLFIETFGGGETAPEPFASCAGGVRSPDGDAGADV